VTYLDRLARELRRVGIRGRVRDRIVAEARDHLAEGDEASFGDPAELARQFADELATDRTRDAALAAFGALAIASLGFAAAWIAIAGAGFPDIASGSWPPLGVAAAIGTVVFPQFAFAAGLLTVLRALRRRADRRLPAAEIDLLLARTRYGLTFGVLSTASLAVCGAEFAVAGWIWPTAAALTIPLAATALLMHRAAAVKSSVPGDAGDVFDDLPVQLPRRPWLLLVLTATAATGAALVAGGVTNEGPRNAVVELVLVVAGFLALGRKLGLRR
jgi:hypothetical protein